MSFSQTVSLNCRWVIVMASVLLAAHLEAAPALKLVRRYTTQDGLPQARVSSLGQTPDGYLWCGTWYGLARFDGVRFVVYDRSSSPGFESSEAVNHLCVGPDGDLWAATGKALVRRNDRGFQEVPFSHSGSGTYHGFALRAAGGVWTTMDREFRIINDSEAWVAALPAPVGMWRVAVSGSGVPFIIEDSAGGLRSWRFEESSHSLTEFPAVDAGVAGRSGIAGSVADGVWAFSGRGLAFLPDRGEMQVHRLPPEFGADPIERAILRRSGGGYWIVTQSDVILSWEPGVKLPVVVAADPNLLHGVSAMLEDVEGNLWIASAEGLLEFRLRSVETLGKDQGLPVTGVSSVSPAPAGGIWVGGEKATVFRLFDGGIEPMPPVGAAHNHGSSISGVLEDSRHRLFGLLPGPSALHQFDAGHWLFLYDTDPYGDAIYEDRKGRLWIGGGGGAACLNGKRWRHWSATNGLPKAGVRVIHQTADGMLWFGSRGAGLVGLDEGRSRVGIFGTNYGLASDEVWAIHETADGALWIGGNRGLARMVGATGVANRTEPVRKDGDRDNPSLTSVATVFSFTSAHGLPKDVVHSILEDRKGYLWLSGMRGIHRVSRAELEEVARGQRETVPCASFGVADGMETGETSGRHGLTGCADADGRLWFPTSKGLVRIEPDKVHVNTLPPVVLVEAVRLDEQWLARDGLQMTESHSSNGLQESQSRPMSAAAFNMGSQPLRLAAGRGQFIQFRYTAPTFINADETRFRYRLRGLSDAWQDGGRERVASFVTLKPGDYVFEVTASNGHGVWAEKSATFAFSLTPQFTQTAWFPASLALGGSALAGALVMLRLGWQRRSLRAEHAAALAEERARIAQDLHDDLGTALTGVALQLDVVNRGTSASGAPDGRLVAASANIRALAARMREVVWAVNPQCDTMPSLAGFLEHQAGTLLGPAGIDPSFEFPERIPPLPLDSATRHHIALAVREILVNCVRHSRATEARLCLRMDSASMSIEIADNGCGFDSGKALGRGQGLGNVSQRLKRLGGACEIESRIGQGTRVVMRLPLPSGQGGES